jgi:hypothetical protein
LISKKLKVEQIEFVQILSGFFLGDNNRKICRFYIDFEETISSQNASQFGEQQ